MQNLQKHLKIYFILLFVFLSYGSISQTLPHRPKLSDVRSYNQLNLLSINAGMSKENVLKTMGGVRRILIFNPDKMLGTKKDGFINNPYSRDLKTGKDGNSIEILWYYTDKKSSDNVITKDELTPIILEKNSVVGLGWGFYEDYAKRQEITIDLR